MKRRKPPEPVTIRWRDAYVGPTWMHEDEAIPPAVRFDGPDGRSSTNRRSIMRTTLALFVSLGVGVMVGVVAMISYSIWAVVDAIDTD